jgi:plastocyanin
MNRILAAALASAFAVAGCSGGYGGGGSTPTAPSPSTGGDATATNVTVSIVGIDGSRAYTPNPVSADSGSRIVFRNNTSVEHHIVMDDGSIDFGAIAAGASSAPHDLPAGNAGTFHCTIHPSMVGSINGSSAPEPPDSGGGVTY